MKLLLDTHVFLWFIEGSPNLSGLARSLIENEQTQKFLSIASLWEISIKISMGKLDIGMTVTDLVEREILSNGILLLDIKIDHLDELAKLPFHHKDPFDRLIISQAMTEPIIVISKDNNFTHYPITLMW